MPSDEPQTPLELSRAATGRRYFRAAPAVYSQLSAGIDQQRGFPQGEGTRAPTLRGLPPAEDLPPANDGSGDVILSVETWRVTADDEAMLAQPISAGLVTELTADEHAALMPPSPSLP